MAAVCSSACVMVEQRHSRTVANNGGLNIIDDHFALVVSSIISTGLQPLLPADCSLHRTANLLLTQLQRQLSLQQLFSVVGHTLSLLDQLQKDSNWLLLLLLLLQLCSPIWPLIVCSLIVSEHSLRSRLAVTRRIVEELAGCMQTG